MAGLVPEWWEVRILDENLRVFDYRNMSPPTLVGITAFTCQASRAYEVASIFRGMRIPVIMGGIHASMCKEEAKGFVDSVVVGEAETVLAKVLEDALAKRLRDSYIGSLAKLEGNASSRHDLLHGKYFLGVLQTSRGCPFQCRFCSVTAFNGARYRRRPIPGVLDELEQIANRFVLFADDNLIGVTTEHLQYAKQLFRGMIQRRIRKRWVAQATINVAQDRSLLRLAKRSGCVGLYIGLESPDSGSLQEAWKLHNLRQVLDHYAEAVRRIHGAGIGVAGSFIVGFDGDKPGIGDRIVHTVNEARIDAAPVTTLTPLPVPGSTRSWRSRAGLCWTTTRTTGSTTIL